MSETLGSPERPVRVAVVGSGPSGFYSIAALLKTDDPHFEVDVFDRLPTPYGLVRGGVAPDHQNIKNVIRVYRKVAARSGFRFFGNVEVGTDVTVEDLRRHYDQVIFAIGNESFRRMGIPGEELKGVHSATEFVGWYNGHPDFCHLEFPLDHVERVVVVGNGNVAMDVTRILSMDPEGLARTDIAAYAVDSLRRSAVKEILVLGRRGPAQAAFATKEIKEIGDLEEIDVIVAPEQAALDTLSQRWLEESGSPGAHKNVEYLTEKSAEAPRGLDRRVTFEFLVSLVESLGHNGELESVKLEQNELFEDDHGTPRPRGTGSFRMEDVQLVLTAVGYRGVPLPGLAFDEQRGVLPNVEGRIHDGQDNLLPGLYAVGWAKGGPTGLIGSNVADAAETVRHMTEDVSRGLNPEADDPDPKAVPRLLDSRNVRWVSFEEWEHLDALEIARGEEEGKIREKFTEVEDMLTALERG